MGSKQLLIAYLALIFRDLKVILRMWHQLIMAPAITTLLYFMVFGRIIGHRVGLMEGHEYISFIFPGLIMLSVITISYAATGFSIFTSKFQRNITEILVSPIPNWLFLLGYLTTGIIRACIASLAIFLVGLLFVPVHFHSLALALFVLLITSGIFALGGIINGMVANKFDDVSFVPTFLLTPLIFLGGVFYSVSSLPPFWHKMSYFNPIIYMIHAFRYGFLGVHFKDIGIAIPILIALFVALYFAAWRIIHSSYGFRK